MTGRRNKLLRSGKVKLVVIAVGAQLALSRIEPVGRITRCMRHPLEFYFDAGATEGIEVTLKPTDRLIINRLVDCRPYARVSPGSRVLFVPAEDTPAQAIPREVRADHEG